MNSFDSPLKVIHDLFCLGNFARYSKYSTKINVFYEHVSHSTNRLNKINFNFEL